MANNEFIIHEDEKFTLVQDSIHNLDLIAVEIDATCIIFEWRDEFGNPAHRIYLERKEDG